jgi:hypothetical protein
LYIRDHITDILLLLPPDHPAISCLQLLCLKLPKFHFTTPVLYSPNEVERLHSYNLDIITNYLCYNNLPVPSRFLDTVYNRVPRSSILQHQAQAKVTNSDPFQRLQRLLKVFNLCMVPADKTKDIIILPNSTLKEEMNLHLSDSSTYKSLSENEYSTIWTSQLSAVREAASYYKLPRLIPSNPSKRYIYFLPKTHKDIMEWRNFYHPKMRPLISDTASITYYLSKHLLNTLQIIERRIRTTVSSSLQVANNLFNITMDCNKSNEIQLCTVDVESLFTNIPQDQLLDIVNLQLVDILTNENERHKYMEFLIIVIKFNTFQVHDRFFLQILGLAMGSPLSGTLANIYLGFMEQNSSNLPQIILFNRYMDDLLLITYFNSEEMERYLENLRSNYQLKLTANFNKEAVNFLDMTITKSTISNQFFTHPFSKSSIFYPLPTIYGRRPFITDVKIIKGQILRAWRLSNQDQTFTDTLLTYFRVFPLHPYYYKLKRAILYFLRPIQLKRTLWTTTIPLCSKCQTSILSKNIQIRKFIEIEHNILAIKQPMNCHSSNPFIIIQASGSCVLEITLSLHWYLQNDKREFIDILPLGNFNELSLIAFLLKHKSVFYTHRTFVLQKRIRHACYLHDIWKKPDTIYGMKVRTKKKKTIANKFNMFRKISRNI